MTEDQVFGMDTIVQDIREAKDVVALYQELLEKMAVYLEVFGDMFDITERHLKPAKKTG